MIAVQDISKTYKSRQGAPCNALQGISSTFDHSKSYAITGASGSGKSTLLKILAGLVRPTSGRVLMQGQDICHLSDDRMSNIRNRKIGIVVQSFALLENETALRNCMISALIAGHSAKDAKKKAAAMLAKVRLTDKIEECVSHLSGGERQRVAIARALMNNPMLLLADEPTGALDSTNAAMVMQELLSVCVNGTTLILATHNEEFANMCGKQIHLKDGIVISQ